LLRVIGKSKIWVICLLTTTEIETLFSHEDAKKIFPFV